MTLVKDEGIPDRRVASAKVGKIDIYIYPSGHCLIYPDVTSSYDEDPGLTFTEQELRELAEAATWAADKLAGRNG